MSKAFRGSKPRNNLRRWAQEKGWRGERVFGLRAFFWMIRSMHTIVYAYIMCYTTLVKKKIMTSFPAAKTLLQQIPPLWPALKGSLAQVRKPCTRPHCPTCSRGDKHPNYLLAFSDKGRRRCLYVPLSMVPILKRALANGRRIERLLYQMGPALLREYREQNPAKTGPAVRLARKKSRSKS